MGSTIHQSRLQQLAREGARYSLQHLNRFREEKRQALLVAFLIRTAQEFFGFQQPRPRTREILVDSYFKDLSSLFPNISRNKAGAFFHLRCKIGLEKGASSYPGNPNEESN